MAAADDDDALTTTVSEREKNGGEKGGKKCLIDLWLTFVGNGIHAAVDRPYDSAAVAGTSSNAVLISGWEL